GDAARRPAHAVAGALAIGAQAACITPPPDPGLGNDAARRTDAHPADPAPRALRIEAVSAAAGPGLCTGKHPTAADDRSAGARHPGSAEGTPAMAGSDWRAGNGGKAGLVLIGGPAGRPTKAAEARAGDAARRPAAAGARGLAAR